MGSWEPFLARLEAAARSCIACLVISWQHIPRGEGIAYSDFEGYEPITRRQASYGSIYKRIWAAFSLGELVVTF